MTLYVQFTDVYPDGPNGASGTGAPGSGSAGSEYPGLPAGATPIHRDAILTAATTGFVLWQPSPSARFVVTGIFVDTDVDQVVTLYDGTNIAGQRLGRASVPAQGGLDPHAWPAVYVSKSAGNALKVDNTGAGNLYVSVDGYEKV